MAISLGAYFLGPRLGGEIADEFWLRRRSSPVTVGLGVAMVVWGVVRAIA